MRSFIFFCTLMAVGCGSDSDPAPTTDAAVDSATDAGSDITLDDAADTGAGGSCPGELAYDPSTLDCMKACAAFGAWCDASACSNPYCKASDCELGCNAVKGTTRFSNVVFGCAAEHADCSGYLACRAEKCP